MKNAIFTRPKSWIMAFAIVLLGGVSQFASAQLGCNDEVNVTLDSLCKATITADMLLEGSPNPVDADFIINVQGDTTKTTPGANVVSGCGLKKYIIVPVDAATAARYGMQIEGCWGYLNLEDKTAPYFNTTATKQPAVAPVNLQSIDTVFTRTKGGTDTLFCTDLSFVLNAASGPMTDVDPLFKAPNAGTGNTPAPWVTSGKNWDPFAVDNCVVAEYSFVDKLNDLGKCGIPIGTRLAKYRIDRTWTVKDVCSGKTGTWTQRIFLFLPRINDVVIPEATTATCGSLGEYPYPYFASAFVNENELNDSQCNLGATFGAIDTIEVCGASGNGRKFILDWTIVDWCYTENRSANSITLGPVVTVSQVVKSLDEDGPTITCPTDFAPWGTTYSTGAFDCTASFAVPAATLSDNCDEEPTQKVWIVTDVVVNTYNHFGEVVSSTIERQVVRGGLNGMNPGTVVSGIPVGDHYFRYVATDACGNKSTYDCEFSVEDKIEPVAVCDDNLHISLGGTGLGRITTADVNEGSWDNCEIEDMAIRRDLKPACRVPFMTQVLNIDVNRYSSIVYSGAAVTAGNSVTGAAIPAGMVVGKLKKAIDGSERFEKLQGLVVEGGVVYTTWDDEEFFICCDLSTAVEVQMIVEDTNGNTNICWFNPTIEDKLVPRCKAPAPVTIACNDPLLKDLDPTNLTVLNERFGRFTAENTSCGVTDTTTVAVSLTCNLVGTIRRTFTVKSANGKTAVCSQTVTITPYHDYSIKFPKDFSFDCNKALSPLDTGVTLTERSCDKLVVSVNSDTLRGGDECYKIARTYRVMNWCEYDGESNPVIVPRDPDGKASQLPGQIDVWVNVQGTSSSPSSETQIDKAATARIDNDNSWGGLGGVTATTNRNQVPTDYATDVLASAPWRNNTGNAYTVGASDYYAVVGSRGFWQYTQYIKVYDQKAPTAAISAVEYNCITDDKCRSMAQVKFTATDDCLNSVGRANVSLMLIPFVTPSSTTADYIQLPNNGRVFVGGRTDSLVSALTGGAGNFDLMLTLPLGTHRLLITIADDCNNKVNLVRDLVIRDCKPVAPICIEFLSVELMPTKDARKAAVGVWESDFRVSSIDDCSGVAGYAIVKAQTAAQIAYAEARFGRSIDKNGNGVIDNSEWNADTANIYKGIELTCADRTIAEQYAVRIYAIDGVGNADYCNAKVFITDNLGSCGVAGPAIAGTIANEMGAGVQSVNVSLNGQTNYTSTTNGTFGFAGLTSGYDYTVTPRSSDNSMTGVSTFDLVLITKHILGTKSLDSPYKMIAADVNNSQTVTTMDLIQLRKRILGISTEFTNNTGWRFIPKSFAFSNPANPWATAIPEFLNYNNLQGAINDANFVAIEVGNVNPEGSGRSVKGTFGINANDATFQAGEEVSVSFTAADLASVSGYQFTMNFDASALELADVKYNVAKEENFGFQATANGVITSSWNGEATTGELFTLVFRAKEAGQLSNLVSVSSRVTRAEAYGQNGDLMNVALRFNNTAVVAGFELLQNTPNPFASTSVIGFHLPEAAKATISVQDVTGKVLKVVNGDFAKGYNQVAVEAKELGATGVLYYTLSTDKLSATKKMIIIE